MLLQYPDDLLFRIPALLHLWSSPSHYERTPAAIGRDFRGQVSSDKLSTSKRLSFWVLGHTFDEVNAIKLPETEFEPARAAQIRNQWLERAHALLRHGGTF